MAGVHVTETKKDKEGELKAFKEAFDYFDWNKNGTIPTKVNYTKKLVFTKQNKRFMIKRLCGCCFESYYRGTYQIIPCGT